MVVQGQSNAVTGAGHATCRECAGNPIVELRCVVCDKVKGLDEFAKNQRHDRDVAVWFLGLFFFTLRLFCSVFDVCMWKGWLIDLI